VLKVLYDAYYEELEQSANYHQRYVSSNGTLPPPLGGPFLGSVELDMNGAIPSYAPLSLTCAQARGAKRPSAVLPPPVTHGRKQQQRTRPLPLNNPPPGKESEFEDDQEDYNGEDHEVEEKDDEEKPEEGEGEEGEEEEEGEAQQPQRLITTPKTTPVARRGQQVPLRCGIPSKGRDGLFNIGTSVTVTGQLIVAISNIF